MWHYYFHRKSRQPSVSGKKKTRWFQPLTLAVNPKSAAILQALNGKTGAKLTIGEVVQVVAGSFPKKRHFSCAFCNLWRDGGFDYPTSRRRTRAWLVGCLDRVEPWPPNSERRRKSLQKQRVAMMEYMAKQLGQPTSRRPGASYRQGGSGQSSGEWRARPAPQSERAASGALRWQERRHGRSHSGTLWRYDALWGFRSFQNCASRCKSVQSVSEVGGVS
jgi:hypothetical protein